MLVLPPELESQLGARPFDALMAYSGEVYRKQPHRETLRIRIQDQFYFIKRHRGLSLKECFKNWFSARLPIIGAQSEWKAIQALTKMDIPTTPLVGYGQRGVWPFTKESFVLTTALDACPSLEETLQTQSLSLREKRAWIAQVAEITRRLHQAGWVHRDLYLCHFLIDPEKKLHLIDLHRMNQPRYKKRWIIKDLSALLFSSLDLGLTRQDALYFWKIYGADKHLIPAVLKRANALYHKAHHDYPPQAWMHPGQYRLPKQPGAFYEQYHFPHGDFHSQQALRVLNKRRWVIKGHWQGQVCVLKLFSSLKEFKKECLGYEALQEHRILTPNLFFYGRFMKFYAMIYAYIDQASAIEKITPGLIKVMAKLHNSGLTQEDCHRENFLYRDGRIYVLDTGSIKIRAKLSHSLALNNLALLYAQWPAREDPEHLVFFPQYLQERQWPASSGVQADFINRVSKIRIRAREIWLRKIFRNCSSIRAKTRLNFRYCTKRDFDTLYTQTLFNYPEAYFHEKATYLKKGNSATVIRTHLGPHDVVIKRFNRKNWIKRLKRYFTESKAARSWKMAHAMESIGIATPKPLAFIEKRFGPFPLDSYYISEYTEGQRLDHLESLEECAPALNLMMDTLGGALCAHGDLKASNILWDGHTLYLLDTDGATFYSNRRSFERAHAADWERLLRNFSGGKSHV